jgi:hypothetical protein
LVLGTGDVRRPKMLPRADVEPMDAGPVPSLADREPLLLCCPGRHLAFVRPATLCRSVPVAARVPEVPLLTRAGGWSHGRHPSDVSGDGAEVADAFHRDCAVAMAHGWLPIEMEWGDSQLIVTYRHQEPAGPPSWVRVRELWRPFAAGILLAALILVVLVPLLHAASQ